MEIFNDKNIFFPKLRQRKIYENNKFKKSEITTCFYGKKENGKDIEERDSFTGERNCEVICYIDIADIFIRQDLLKVRTYITDVILIKEDVPSPIIYVEKTRGVTLDSDDEK